MDVSALRPDRPVVVGAFVVVFVAASATFALTAAGHYDTYTADRLGGTITGYDVVEEDGEHRVVAEMTVENDLNRPVTVGAGQLRVVAADEKLTLNAGGFVGEQVPAGGERTFRVPLRLQEEEVPTAAAAARNGTLKVSGIYRATIEAEEIEFSVSTGGETDG